jgi:hypothetical protein
MTYDTLIIVHNGYTTLIPMLNTAHDPGKVKVHSLIMLSAHLFIVITELLMQEQIL